MSWRDEDEVIAPPPLCWLCGRPLGEKVEWHHPVPKSKGGRIKAPIHPICHQTVHANFKNAELARLGPDPAVLLKNETVRRFVEWVSDKDPDFYAPTAKKR